MFLVLVGCGRFSFEDHRAGLDAPGGDGPQDGPAAAARSFVISGNGTLPTTLLELDLTTGQLTQVGTIPASLGVLGGLAAWDANTMYATSSSGELIQITLAPFGAQMVRSVGGNISSLERRGSMLFGINESADVTITFDPAGGVSAGAPLGVAASGGDLAELSDGTWYYFSNATTQLYRLDVAGTAIAVGSPATGAPFASGLVRDGTDQLFVVASGSDELIPIDRTTGQLGAPISVCQACPTPYDLLSGDATRMP